MRYSAVSQISRDRIDDTPVAAEKELPGWLIRAIEKEWRDPVRLKPIETHLRERKLFWQQLRKRFPPNPVQATIEMEGDFDRLPRILYQTGDMFFRILPSLKRFRTLFGSRNTGR